MLPIGLEACSPAEWEIAIIRATDFAYRLSRKLPRHLTVDDVVHTAVEQLLASKRTFDLRRHSLAAILCGTVKSILSPKGLAEFKERMPLATDYQVANTTATHADDESLFTQAERDQIMDRVRDLGQGDAVFLQYVDAFQANFSADETAELLGISKDQCYELRRKLKTLTARVVAEFKPADLQHLNR